MLLIVVVELSMQRLLGGWIQSLSAGLVGINHDFLPVLTENSKRVKTFPI
jgi:hypothetical protein